MNTYCAVCGDPVDAGGHRCPVAARPGRPIATLPLGPTPSRTTAEIVRKDAGRPAKRGA